MQSMSSPCMSNILALVLGPIINPDVILVPTFSVDLAGVDGLNGPTLAPNVSPTFKLTLHAVSSRSSARSWGLCQESGTVAVSYAGAVLAWGRVPGVCVPAHAEQHVRMVALGAGVGLSDELRRRMASERRSRSAELDVDIVLGRDMMGRSRDDWVDDDEKRFLSCRVKLDQPSSSQPSPCQVLVS